MLDLHGWPLHPGDRVTVATTEMPAAVLTGARGIVVDIADERVHVLLDSLRFAKEEPMTVALSPHHLAYGHFGPVHPGSSMIEILDDVGRSLARTAVATAVRDCTITADQGEKLLKIWNEQVMSSVSSLEP